MPSACYFKRQVDELKIWSSALTSSQIQAGRNGRLKTWGINTAVSIAKSESFCGRSWAPVFSNGQLAIEFSKADRKITTLPQSIVEAMPICHFVTRLLV
jgi:hypothetical protein